MHSFIHISKNTLRECLRDPLYIILLTTALFLIGLYPHLSFFVFRQQIKLILDSSLATTMVFGFIVSIFCASQTVSKEIQQGTVFLLLSKPVHRWTFILSKQVGVVLAITLFVISCSAATLVVLKVGKDQFKLNEALSITYFCIIGLSHLIGGVRNYITRRSYSSTAVIALVVTLVSLAIISETAPFIEGAYNAPSTLNIIYAQVLTLFSVITMTSVALAISTRCGVFLTLTVSAVVFLLGLANSFLCTKIDAFSHTLSLLIKTTIPNWQFFWIIDALSSNIEIPAMYIYNAAVYMILYVTICSLWSVFIFKEREIAA